MAPAGFTELASMTELAGVIELASLIMRGGLGVGLVVGFWFKVFLIDDSGTATCGSNYK